MTIEIVENYFDILRGKFIMQFLPSAPLENIRRRAEIIKSIRRFFDERDFIEVQTPILSRDTVIDHYLDPLSLPVNLFGKEEIFYLQTSPEFALKRLVTAGMKRIFEITPVFRKGDRGQHHNVEFTMLEWYRVGDDYRQGIDFLADLVTTVGGFDGCDKVSFAQLVRDHIGLDPDFAGAEDYLDYVKRKGIAWSESFLDPENPATADDWLDLIFSEEIQPRLGSERPIILYDYPATQAQLARTRTKNENGREYQVAERFELFIKGLELANGYHELREASVLRERNKITAEERRRSKMQALPQESRLLQAMEFGFPDCSGCALGIERLLMILLNADSIDQVLTFPIERA